jgi:Protein of unknown function (DUF3375)
MSLDFSTLDLLRQNHPAWRLLRSEHAPLVASFLHRLFVAPNVRVFAQADLSEALEDDLYALREQLGADAFPKTALEYLNDWAANEKGWLRKFYPQGSDEPHYDLTPATEKAIAWLGSLAERPFVGTESRLLTLFELLQQISTGSQLNPRTRALELKKRRDQLDAEIVRALAGEAPLMTDTEIKDRFQQFMNLARELLSDFREVEHNFRGLDRHVRERVALWDGGKGQLLQEIMGERDAIADSDQGKSFRAFWDFLMSASRQGELTALLEHVLSLPAVTSLKPDNRTRRVHYDWLEAGEHTQRTVALLSQQLRRFLDNQAWLENRRIMDILHGIESKSLAMRHMPPPGEFMTITGPAADIELPMERPLYSPPLKPKLADLALHLGDDALDSSALYSQVVIDKAQLAQHIRQSLQDRAQVTLRELCEMRPLEHGVAELVAYLQLASDQFKSAVDEESTDAVEWTTPSGVGERNLKRAHLPRVVFIR